MVNSTDDIMGELASLHAIGEEPEEPKADPPAVEPPPDPDPSVQSSNAALADGLDRMIGVLDGLMNGVESLRAIVADLRTALVGPLDEAEAVEAAAPVREAPMPARRAVKAPLPPTPPEVSRQLPPATPTRRVLSPIQKQIAERRARAYASATPGALPSVDAGPEVTIEELPGATVSAEDRADVEALTGMRRPAPATPEEADNEAKVAAQRRLAEVGPDNDFSDWGLNDEPRPRGREQGAVNGSKVPTA